MILFGDSWAAGTGLVDYENSFPHLIGVDVCVAEDGSCFGEYSPYPVYGKSLETWLSKNEALWGTKALLEFGINDCTAYALQIVNQQQIFMSIMRSLTMLEERECPYAYLSLSDTPIVLMDMAERIREYLYNDYGICEIVPSDFTHQWTKMFNDINNFMRTKAPFLTMVDDVNLLDKHGQYDGLHPNDLGHSVVAAKVFVELNKYFGLQ